MRHVARCFALLFSTLFSALFPALFPMLFSAGLALAQVGGTGSIEGTVTDPSGAAVAGAAVTATNIATGSVTARKTTDAGFFVLPLLPAGEYTITVTAT